MRGMNSLFVSICISLLVSEFVMTSICLPLRITQKLWHDRVSPDALHRTLLIAMLAPLLIGFSFTSLTLSSALWCISHAHALVCDWQLQRCFLQCPHLCSHATKVNALTAKAVAHVLGNITKVLGALLLVLFTCGRIFWLSVWRKALKTPSKKLVRLTASFPEFSKRRVNIAECESWFCQAGIFGWLSPTIVVSSELVNELSDEELGVLIKHELAHKRRLDQLKRLIMRMLTCIFFAVPYFIWLKRKAEGAMEAMANSDALKAVVGDAEGDDLNALREQYRRLALVQLSIFVASITCLCGLFSKPVFATAHCFFEVVLSLK